jgi:hypothetical protein
LEKLINLKNSEEVINHFLRYKSGWIFRGHSKVDWKLESSLERLLSPIGWDPAVAKRCEDYTLSTFQSKAHHYISQDLLPTSKLGWLSMMQHHGVPTRLLDFTESPFFALFFAFNRQRPKIDEYCALWAINCRQLMQNSIAKLESNIPDFKYTYNDVSVYPDEIFSEYIDTDERDLLWVTEPKLRNLRLERQKGTFLICGNIEKRIQDVLFNNISSEGVHKIIIPFSISREIFHILNSMGIDNSRLFDNIDGLSADINNTISDQVPNTILQVNKYIPQKGDRSKRILNKPSKNLLPY